MLGPVQWMLSGVCQRKSIAPGIAFLGQSGVTSSSPAALDVALLRRGRLLEWFTLGWNVVGVLVLAMLAVTASSVALAGFGLDSFIEIGASALVLWELSGTG